MSSQQIRHDDTRSIDLGVIDRSDPSTSTRSIVELGGTGTCLGVNVTDYGRRRLGLRAGDQVIVKVLEDGSGIFIAPVRS